MIGIRLVSDQGMTEVEQLNKLKHLAQTAIFTEAFADLKPTDLPEYVLAFRFEINPVNYPQYTIFALLQGVDPQWYDKFDHISLNWLMDEIYSNYPPDDQGNSLPKILDRPIDRGERLGLVLYTSSTKVAGGYGQTIAVAYAPTIPGYKSAVSLVQAFKGKVLTIYGGLPVTVEPFPPRDSPNGSRKQNDHIVNFARTSILSNNKVCSEAYTTVMLDDGVTNAIAQSRTRINMHVQYKHITGIVPHTIKLKRSPENHTCNFGYAGIIVLHRDSNVVGRGKSFFKKLFQSALPELFPEEIDDDTTGADGFITVGGKKKSSNATSTALSVKETVS